MAQSQVLEVVKGNYNVPLGPPSPTQDCKIETLASKRVVVFFIGGAGDKEPYYGGGPFRNIAEVRKYFDPKVEDLAQCHQYTSAYLGYNEVKGRENIEINVIKNIPSKLNRVYIVGHSLGGWNGAHLSAILSSQGYTVEMLITLDPVGEGVGVWAISNIYKETPKPSAKEWINVLAKPLASDSSDMIADLGSRWIVKSGPKSNYIANLNHYNAIQMFKVAPMGKKSAADELYASIRKVVTR